MTQPDWDFEALRAETLDPELAACVIEGPLGPMIKHPLVFDVTGTVLPGIPNRVLRTKKKMLLEYEADKKWHSWVFTHERAYRCDALIKVMHEHGEEISDRLYWKLVGNVWTDSENIYQNSLEWAILLGSDRGEREAIMSEEDLATYRALPDPITVYRGAIECLNEDGLSWSTDKKRAEWFARRFQNLRDGDAVVLTGTVAKEDALAYFSDRNESEILVVEGSVRITTVEMI